MEGGDTTTFSTGPGLELDPEPSPKEWIGGIFTVPESRIRGSATPASTSATTGAAARRTALQTACPPRRSLADNGLLPLPCFLDVTAEIQESWSDDNPLPRTPTALSGRILPPGTLRAARARPDTGSVTPEVRYARSRDVSIAYQVIGDGPFDLVWTTGAFSHLGLKGVPGTWRLYAVETA